MPENTAGGSSRQFMTPSTVARFMVSLFSSSNLHTVRLLDAGAGIGSLSGAFLDSIAAGDLASQHVEVVAYEIDDNLRNHLSRALEEYQGKLNLDVSVLSGDFIEEAVISYSKEKNVLPMRF
jgi:adenine-specific DNA-methyltransferase